MLTLFRTLPAESLTLLCHALLEQLPQDSSPLVMVVKPDPTSPISPKTNGHRQVPGKSNYDPSVLYILELATMLAIRDEKSVQAVGKEVAEALQNIVRDSTNVHPMVLSRTVFYLLHILTASHVSQNFSQH